MILTSTFFTVLVSFLGSLERPATLVTNLCVSPGQLIQFNRHLTTHHPTLIRHLHTLSELNEANEHQVLVVLDLSCKDLNLQLVQNSTKRNLNFNYRWFLVDIEDISRTRQRALDTFSGIEILHSSEIYFCDVGKDFFDIQRIYRHSLATDLIVEPIFQATLKNPSARTWTRLYPSLVASRIHQGGLGNTSIRTTISILNNDTWNHLTDYHDPHIESFAKMGYHMTLIMLGFLNGTANYSKVQGWGYRNNETGEYTGMFGQLIRNEANIAANLWFANLVRFEHLQFISMACDSKLRFIFQAPKLTMTDNVYLLPFQWVSGKVDFGRNLLITHPTFSPSFRPCG